MGDGKPKQDKGWYGKMRMKEDAKRIKPAKRSK